jgi:hypothetical protein
VNKNKLFEPSSSKALTQIYAAALKQLKNILTPDGGLHLYL